MATVSVGDPVLLGWSPDGPTLRLDYRRFSYAGKFVVSTTGKAVIPEQGAEPGGADAGAVVPDDSADGARWDDGVLAAASFNEDRTDGEALWIRYVTVRADLRGEGLGPRLCAFVVDEAADRGYERVRIAVNNPFAYEALYRAGFAFAGEETGIAELLLERQADAAALRAADRPAERYREGLEIYARRELSPEETAFVERKRDGEPPEPLI